VIVVCHEKQWLIAGVLYLQLWSPRYWPHWTTWEHPGSEVCHPAATVLLPGRLSPAVHARWAGIDDALTLVCWNHDWAIICGSLVKPRFTHISYAPHISWHMFRKKTGMKNWRTGCDGHIVVLIVNSVYFDTSLAVQADIKQTCRQRPIKNSDKNSNEGKW